MIQHAVFLDELDGVVERQHADSRSEPDVGGALGYRRQEHVLRRGQTMHRRSVMLGQMIGVITGLIQNLYLFHAQDVGFLQSQAGNGFDMVKNAKLKGHLPSLLVDLAE